MAKNVLGDEHLLVSRMRGFIRAEQVHKFTLAIWQLIIDNEGLLEGRNVLSTVLDAHQPAIYIRVDELQVFEGVLPAND